MNQATYKTVLEENLLPSALTMFPNSDDWSFQQGNAPYHTARGRWMVTSHQTKLLEFLCQEWHKVTTMSKTDGKQAKTHESFDQGYSTKY
ncbi:hypothetical protein P4O66_015882 [Electrophorus voltai]|uniref:Uncharacterized protein n=1 Tax=Electrophorus voltai TaxID=2609070 RepID=A0AAD9DNA1_9TELE|nr:hypothetical protein P4O66_015882 [Electrophorus voltai]